MNSTTSNFRLLKSGWGIYIEITGSSRQINSPSSILKLDINFNLFPQELLYLNHGFNTFMKNLDTSFEITLNEINFTETDLQEEGFYYAIKLWLSEHFKIEFPKFESSFNKEINRYEFPELKKVDAR